MGLDVHARSVAAAAIDGVTGELRQARLTPAFDEVRGRVAGLPGPAAVIHVTRLRPDRVNNRAIHELEVMGYTVTLARAG